MKNKFQKQSDEQILRDLEQKTTKSHRPGFCGKCGKKKPTKKVGKLFLCKDCIE
jgi:NADH pyrophosphatase NudC (nudix superfamily)